MSRTCTGKYPNNDSDLRVADQQLSSFTISLPCSVPEEYQLNQRVCEINQAILGYAGDPQPVVQNVQVHAVGFFVGFFFFGPEDYLRWLSDTFQCHKARLGWWRALPATGRTASRCDRLTRRKKHPTDAIWIQPTRSTVYSNTGPVSPTTRPLLLKAQAQIKCLARAEDGGGRSEVHAIISASGDFYVSELKHLAPNASDHLLQWISKTEFRERLGQT